MRNRIIKQTVDREIAPADVLSGVREDDPGRTPAVDVSFVGTECRNFKWLAAKNYENDTELCAHALGPRKYLSDPFRPCAGWDVISGRCALHHHIPHASSYERCSVPSLA